MADPSQMFNIAPEVNGPLAGYMQGFMGDYGMQQQDQAAEQRRIANEAAQLALENAQKEVPLQDAERSNKLWTAKDDASAIASGQAGRLRQGARDLTEQDQESKITTSKLIQMKSAAGVWNEAEQAMKVASPANKQAIWETYTDQAKRLGIKDWPKEWNADSQSFVATRGAAARASLDVMQKELLERFQTDEKKRLWDHELPGKKEIAALSAAGTDRRALLGKSLGERVIIGLQQKEVLTLDDIDNAMSVVKKEVIAEDTTIKEAAAQATRRWVTAEPKEREDYNTQVGLPKGNKDDQAFGKAVQDKFVAEAAKERIDAYLAGRNVQTPDGVKPITAVTSGNRGAAKATGTTKAAEPPMPKNTKPSSPADETVAKAMAERFDKANVGVRVINGIPHFPEAGNANKGIEMLPEGSEYYGPDGKKYKKESQAVVPPMDQGSLGMAP